MVTTWTDDPLNKTVPCKARHVNELRDAIEAVPGVTVIPWGRGNRVGSGTPIRAQNMLDLRAAIGPQGSQPQPNKTVWDVRSTIAGLMLWTESAPGTGPLGRILRASHVDDLRRWFNTSETGAASYQFPRVRPLMFGINPTWFSAPGSYPDPRDDQMLIKLRAAGATCVRSGIDWANIELSRGNRDYGLYDYRVNLALKYGLAWIANVGTAPAWAATGPTPLQMPVNDPNDYVNFVQATAQHFLGRIHHYECGNEPDGAGNWNYPSGVVNIQDEGTSYAAWLQRFYTTIKGVDPAAWVSTGGVGNLGTSAGLPFIGGIYAAGGGRASFDAIACHPYGPDPTQSLDKGTKLDDCSVLHAGAGSFPGFEGIIGLRKIMDCFGDEYKPIWLTEYGGYHVGQPPDPTRLAQQASNLQDALTWLANTGTSVTVATFQIAADIPSNPGASDTGLMDASLNTNRPAYGTFSGFPKPTT